MNIKRPAISIVMPLYNKEREVVRAISSVLVQTIADFELVVVDDGSTDGGPVLVAGCNDPRIRLIRQQNVGVSAARNHGIAEARADLMAFLDADDEWMPEFLDVIFRLRTSFPTCSVYATAYLFRDAKGNTSPAILRKTPVSWEGVLEDYFTLASISDPPLWTSAVAVEKSAIIAAGGFPVGVKSGEDLLTWARLALKNKIAYSAFRGAIYWIPEVVDDRPGRFVDNEEDVVGNALARMLTIAPSSHISGLRKYLGRWHEMRAIISLYRNRKVEVFCELRRILVFTPASVKLVVIGLLACLPGSLSGKSYKYLKKLTKHNVREGGHYETP